ncbi:MAG: hypothetical protein H0W74_04445 [Sphingosinicella sp.]|nr:hypothetical protein [Sphingosinicella sp.]
MGLKQLPHEQVMVRLAPSPISGIGVFSAQHIGEGTNIFANDMRAIRWISEKDVAALSGPQRALYDDFAIRRDGEYGCPENFNLLTVGWYLNEPAAGQSPNVHMTEDYQIIASRDIATGEEITVRYSTFSDSV